MKLEKIVLIVATLTSFFTVFLSSAVMVAVPTLASEFGMSNIIQNWVTMLFFLAVAIFTIPSGQLSGKFGLKKSMIFGSSVYILSSIAAIFSINSEIFLICRLVQGIGVSFLNVASMAMVVSAFSPQERGKAIGINVTGVYLATSTSPVIGGFLNFHFGWRSIFLTSVPFLILILVLLITEIKEEWVTMGDVPIDWKGSIVYSLGILLFIYGFTRLDESTGIILTVIGLIVLGVFVALELREKYPVFDVKFFKNPKFSSANFAALTAYLATFAVTTIVNYHLQYIRGYDSQMAGIILLVAPLIQVIMAPISGRLSDKINPQKLAAIGMFFGAISLAMLSMLNVSTPLWFLIIAMVSHGLGFGIFSSPNTNAIMGSVPQKDTPVASASVATMRVIGQTMSMGMLTLVFAFVMGNVPMIEKYFPLLITSSQITCLICMVLCAASVFASLVGIKSKEMLEFN
ncbi:MAG: MFS transporter [archaeon]|uniref:EmrB/QacA subfamily drug resistance transporter n=1 Tax=Methanobrevibacter gottschalkii DSM 11977 TaxID=1122229 RepID=A0A3N5C8N7_9EURY|nr:MULTISPECIES: MFS transporter [Methanobrevibacter]MCQ2971080.1 MFS transporter [archaeon]OEC95845.1 MFS transporter [Methanobrevibacter sp. A27]RPF52931.1 EmrB/QacA subfamily drug resistance transporter [Methanobrevibacter gottschalkii DSM 11977]